MMLQQFIILNLFFVACYIIFKSIFFIFFANISVDLIIGISFLIVFFILYKLIGIYIYFYFVNIIKNIYIHYILLLNFVYSLREFILLVNKNFIKILRFNFVNINLFYHKFSFYISDLFNKLLFKFFTNYYLYKLVIKFNIVFGEKYNIKFIVLSKHNVILINQLIYRLDLNVFLNI